jgi:RHS repeat-associated protein
MASVAKLARNAVRLKRYSPLLLIFMSIAFLVCGAPTARAQSEATPAEAIGTAPLLTPTAVDAYYGSATTSTNGLGFTSRPPEVVELARALAGNTAAVDPANPTDAYKTVDRIYQYVLNNIDVVWLYGLQKGSVGTIIDHAGTPFDQAMLMVELLRQDGYTASYQVGQITLTGTQFYDWTGIQNAQAACQLLSNGSIGAVINSTTDSTCASYASTNVSTITLNHVWVSVVLGGTTYYFDPSYKAHLHKAGVNLATTASMTTGAPLTQATTSMTSANASSSTDPGLTGTLPYVQSLNTTALYSTISTYGGNLLTYIKANPNSQMEDIVGGEVISRYEIPAGGLRQTALSEAASTQHTWTGSIPNQYRTTLEVKQTVGGLTPSGPLTQTQIWDKTLYVDEIYGRKLVTAAPFNPNNTDPTVFNASLIVADETGNGVAGAPTTIASYSGSIAIPLRGGPLTLTVNHPYAASADGTSTTHGDYMDSVVVKQTNLMVPFIIVNAWGDANGLSKYYGSRNDTVLPARLMWCDCDPGNGLEAGDGKRESLAASWIVQSSKAARLHAAIAGGIYQLHHAVGVVNGDAFLGQYSQAQDPTFLWSTLAVPLSQSFYALVNTNIRLDVDSGFSLVSKTADAVARRAAIFSIAATTDALEGSVVEQQSDLPDTTSTATRFEWGNAPPTSEDLFTKGPRRFFNFTASNAGSTGYVIRAEGRNDFATAADACPGAGTGAYSYFPFPGGAPALCNAAPSITDPAVYGGPFWINNLTSAIAAYTAAGYSVTASDDAHLGPGQPFGSPQTKKAGSVQSYQPAASFQRGGAFVAVKYSGSDPVLIAHVVVGVIDGADVTASKGGAGGVQPDNQLTFDPAKAADILKTRFVDHSSALGVDVATGGVGYTPPAQLSVGNGEFPYKLTAQSIWTGGDAAAPERPSDSDYSKPTDPGTPWTTNWNSRLAVGSSGNEALGASDPRAAAGTIAAFLAMQDIYKATPTTQRDVAGVLANAWWVHQVAGNTVTATLGASTKQFLRLVDGTYITPGAGYASLAVTGSRVICTTASGCNGGLGFLPYTLSRGWDYQSMSFAITGAQGDVQHYSFWRNNFSDGKHHVVLKGFRLSAWTFPQGVTVTVNYGPNTALPTTADTILSVSNNLGRQINFVNLGAPDVLYGYFAGGFTNNLTGTDARSVGVTGNGGGWTFTDQTGAQTTVVSTVVPWGLPLGTYDSRYLLSKIYTADNPPVGGIAAPLTPPSLEYDYDSLRRVMQAKDGDALQLGTHAPYQFYIADHVRGERQDPMGADFAVEYDIHSQPYEYFDELGREVVELHDSRGRATNTTYPEGDQEQFTYDDRGNTLSLTKVAKPGSGLANIVESATWDATWNKPLTITDALGNVTTFAYGASGTSGAGEMLTATRPADIDGAHPVYTFTYSSIGKLLTATDPTSVVTQNTYDSTYGNLLTTTLDPGSTPHIAAVTSFTYDANGEAITTTDPRSNVSNMTYDLAGRKIFDIAPDPDGAGALLRPATRSVYDALGRVIEADKGRTTSTTGADFAVLESATTTYDPDSKKIKEVTPAGVTQFTYDGDDRLTCSAARMFPGAYAALPASACTLGSTNPSNLPDRITQTNYDVAGQTLTKIQAYGTSAQRTYATYTYGLDGEGLTVTDSNGNLTKSIFDGFNRLTQMQFPSTTRGAGTPDTGDHEDYTYDAGGNRLTLTKRDQVNRLTFTYDAMNRPIVKDANYVSSGSGLPEVKTYTDYDLGGRHIHEHFVSRTGTGVDYAYNTAGWLTSETTFSKAMSFAYDAAGNRTKVTWPDSFYAAYGYDADNRLTSVGENGATSGAGLIDTFTYDDLGRRTALTRGNGTSTAYSYDGADRLTALGHTLVTTTYNQTWAFGYNQASQKIARTSSNSLYEWTPPSPATVSKTYDGLNRDATIAAVTGGYDANGNLTNDGTRVFTYDRENRLLSASAPTAVTLSYDPTGRLNQTTAGSTVTNFLYEGSRLSAEYDGSGNVLRRYVHGTGVDEPLVWFEGASTTSPTAQWLHQDPQGSVIAWSDASGSVTSSQVYAYGPYGEPSSWTGSRFRYTGQIMLPEMQLYYYKARVYDPLTGRFLQTDPIGYKSDVDLYAYAAEDPINHSDPSGQAWDWKKIFEIVKGVVDSIGVAAGNPTDPPKIVDIPEHHQPAPHPPKPRTEPTGSPPPPGSRPGQSHDSPPPPVQVPGTKPTPTPTPPPQAPTPRKSEPAPRYLTPLEELDHWLRMNLPSPQPQSPWALPPLSMPPVWEE